MTRWEEYKAGEKEPRRIEGTNIGKAAVREFVRGLELRESSPYEPGAEAQQHKVATAAFHFFKWLAEIPGYGSREDQSAKVLVTWKDEDGNVYYVSNMLAREGSDMNERDYSLWGCRDLMFKLFDILTAIGRRHGYFNESPVPKRKGSKILRFFRKPFHLEGHHD